MSPADALRFAGAELGLVFRRRRNLVLLGVLGLVPVVIAIAVRADDHVTYAGSLFAGVTDNGLFAALAAFLVCSPLFLPLAVAVVAGDAIAGEASAGTLRYLLTVPTGRTRLLAVKFATVLAWCVACVLAVLVTGVLAGLIVFPSGEVTLLSGRTVSYATGFGRLLLAGAYVAATVAMVGALGLFVSTMTDVPLAAMAATLTATILSQVLDAVPDLAAIHGWLPTHYWLTWIDLLRDPVRTGQLHTGLWVSLAYVAIFTTAAWARFSSKDVVS